MGVWPRDMARNPFRYFKTSPEIIQLAAMMYVQYPLSLRNIEDLLHERGIDICHETVHQWVDRIGTYFAHRIRKGRSERMRQSPRWQWHLDEVFVEIRGQTHYLWRAVDHEDEVPQFYVSKTRDKSSALKFMRRVMKRYGNPQVIVTDRCLRPACPRRTETGSSSPAAFNCHEVDQTGCRPAASAGGSRDIRA